MNTSSWISKFLLAKVHKKEGAFLGTQRIPKSHSSFGQRPWEKNFKNPISVATMIRSKKYEFAYEGALRQIPIPQ